jgi:hypothetical protein
MEGKSNLTHSPNQDAEEERKTAVFQMSKKILTLSLPRIKVCKCINVWSDLVLTAFVASEFGTFLSQFLHLHFSRLLRKQRPLSRPNERDARKEEGGICFWAKFGRNKLYKFESQTYWKKRQSKTLRPCDI